MEETCACVTSEAGLLKYSRQFCADKTLKLTSMRQIMHMILYQVRLTEGMLCLQAVPLVQMSFGAGTA